MESELAVGGERGEGEENGYSLQEGGTAWPGLHSRSPALTPGGLIDLQTEPYTGVLEAWEHLEAKAPIHQAGEDRGFTHASPSCTGFDREGKDETQNSQPSPAPHSPQTRPFPRQWAGRWSGQLSPDLVTSISQSTYACGPRARCHSRSKGIRGSVGAHKPEK